MFKMATHSSRKACSYLLKFAHDHLEFRIHEIKSILNLFKINFNISKEYDFRNPYCVIELDSEEEARQLMSRTVTVKSLYEVWAQGDSYESLFNQIQSLPNDFIGPYVDESKSYRVKVHSFNKQISQSEKVAIIEQLFNGPLTFKGKLDLSDNSNNTFELLEYYGPQGTTPQNLEEVYFGRWICDGQRDFINRYNLQKRKFIGNTSMDPMLSMIIANMAKIGKNCLVHDPFVGTGSLLVACAHYGAYVMGTDIDYNLLSGVGKSSRAGQKWRSKEETIRNNLHQYGLGHLYIDTFIADASLQSMWRSEMFFDAIVTDPPYGIREPMMKIGSRKEPTDSGDGVPQRDDHIPSKTSYNMFDIIRDLFQFGARHLVLGGRLVFWMPVCRDEYKEENIPSHECFQLIANSEQILNKRVSRRLLTMEKVQHYQVDETNSADKLIVLEDHYKDASFRDRYFRPAAKSRCKSNQTIAESSPS